MSRTLLREVLSVETHSRNTGRMTAFILAFAETHGITARVDEGNVYLTKGEAEVYPCIVAHTDTVHRVTPNGTFRVMETDGRFFGYDVATGDLAGVGGDDKCGVYIALQLLLDLPAAKAAFFRDEEIGCHGAALADFAFFKDCAFALQADRRGRDDVVVEACSTEMTSDEFNAAIFPMMAKYSKTFCRYGSLTDVQDLKASGLPICAINASAGYHNPHSDREYVVIREVMRTKRFFYDICRKLGNRQWAHTVTRKPRAGTYGSWKQETYEDARSWAKNLKTKAKGKHSYLNKRHEMIDGVLTLVLSDEKDLHKALCPDCFHQQLFWDDVEKAVWCAKCAGWAAVIIEDADLLEALPPSEVIGEGAS